MDKYNKIYLSFKKIKVLLYLSSNKKIPKQIYKSRTFPTSISQPTMKTTSIITTNDLFTDCIGEQQNTKYRLRCFVLNEVKRIDLGETLEENQQIFSQLDDKPFKENFLKVSTTQTDDLKIFITDFYEENLEQHINRALIKQPQALKIFQDIIKAVYSLSVTEKIPINLRPEHFVFVDGKWKLRNIVYTDDITRMKGFNCEYIWSPKYQSPQQINKVGDTLQEYGPRTVVWNLGCILLDMLVGTHKLKDKTVIQKFKNKPFSLQKVGIKVHFSKKLQDYLSRMLHYNEEDRMSLGQIYEDSFFSQQVADKYKNYKKKNGQQQSQKMINNASCASKNPDNSIRRSSKSSIKGSQLNGKAIELKNQQKIFNDIRKSSIMSSKVIQQGSECHNLQSMDDFMFQLKQKSKIVKPDGDKSSLTTIKKQQTIKSLEKIDPKLQQVFQLYKTYWDKAEFLCLSYEKIEKIPYPAEQSQQILLLSKFALYYYAGIELSKMVKSLNYQKNIFQLDESLFQQFVNSAYFTVFRQKMNDQLRKKQTVAQKIELEIKNRVDKKLMQLHLLKKDDMLNFVRNVDFQSNTFADIKTPYRRIIKRSYDILTSIYNKNPNPQICRTTMYAVYCMTADKLYSKNHIEENFEDFFQWMKIPKGKIISIIDLQKYFQQADPVILIRHSQKILQKYYKT